MSKYGPDSAFVLVSGRNITGECLNFSDAVEAMLTESEGLGDSWFESLATGMRKGTIAQDSWFDDDSNSTVAVFIGSEQTERVVSWGYATTAIGAKFVGAKGAFGGKSSRVASRSDLHHCKAEWTVSGNIDNGIILKALSAETTASGNTDGASSQDAGASSASGGAAYVQLTALTLGGYTNLALTVRHSSDDVTYAALATFTVLTAIGAERVAVASGTTINRHLSCSWAYNGAGSGQSFTAMIGFARG